MYTPFATRRFTDPGKIRAGRPRHLVGLLWEESARIEPMSETPAGPLAALRMQSRKGLQYSMSYLLANAESTLMGLASKAPDKRTQNQYFEAARELRIKRILLEEKFLTQVMAGFENLGQQPIAVAAEPASPSTGGLPTLDLDNLSLVQDTSLEESIAIDNIAGRARHQHLDVLMQLAHGVARELGLRRPDIDALPIGPQVLSRVFMDVCNEVEVSPQSKMAFAKLFTRFIIDELEQFYAQCLAALPHEDDAAAPESPGLVPALQTNQLPSAARNETPAASPTEQKTDTAWDLSRTPLLAPPGKAPAMPRNLLDELLMNVQKRLLDRKTPLAALNPKAGIRPLEIFELLNEGLQELGYTRASAVPFDALEAINLVTLLFEHALRDQQVPQPIRRLVRLLQIPVLRVALRDSDVLTNTDHPVRQLIKEMGTAAIGWTPEADLAKDEFYRQLQAPVVKIVSEFDKEAGIFKECLETLRTYLKAERGPARLLERKTLNAETGKAEAEMARAAVATLVKDTRQSRALASAVSEFLHGEWSEALFVIRLQDGAKGSAWEIALETTARLVALAADGTGSFAVVAQGLKLGLRRLGQDEVAVSKLLEGLEQALRQSTSTLTESVGNPQQPRAPAKPASEHSLQIIDKMPPDTWVEFREPGKEVLRARLLTKIPATGQFLFVNRVGAKAGEWSRDALGLAVEAGTAVIVSVPGGSSPPSGVAARWGRR